MVDQAYVQIPEPDQFVLSKNGVFVGKGYACDGMFKLNDKMNEISVIWHAHLCHINFKCGI